MVIKMSNVENVRVIYRNANGEIVAPQRIYTRVHGAEEVFTVRWEGYGEQLVCDVCGTERRKIPEKETCKYCGNPTNVRNRIRPDRYSRVEQGSVEEAILELETYNNSEYSMEVILNNKIKLVHK